MSLLSASIALLTSSHVFAVVLLGCCEASTIAREAKTIRTSTKMCIQWWQGEKFNCHIHSHTLHAYFIFCWMIYHPVCNLREPPHQLKYLRFRTLWNTHAGGQNGSEHILKPIGSEHCGSSHGPSPRAPFHVLSALSLKMSRQWSKSGERALLKTCRELTMQHCKCSIHQE
jgi:hypothetical protein